MPYLTPDSLPAATQCMTVEIPDDARLIAAVLGALQELTYPYNWELFGAVTPDQTAEACMSMWLAAMESVCVVPFKTRFTNIMPVSLNVVAGAGLAWSAQATQMLGGVWTEITPANNVRYRYSSFIPSGKYRIHTYGLRTSDMGDEEITLDGVQVGTFSWYFNGAQLNVQWTTALIDITEGDHDIDWHVTGKVGASSNFRTRKSWIVLERISDL